MQISNEQIHVVFTAVTSIGILLQAIVLLSMAIGLRRMTKKFDDLSTELRENVLPTIASSRGLLEELSPKIKVITNNLVEISHTVRHQVTHIDHAVADVVDRTQHQAARVDGILSETLDSLNRATVVVQETVAVPIRQVSGLLNGVRAGIEALRHRSRNGIEHPDHLE
jgi:methyl-accepting chemotaxis protein